MIGCSSRRIEWVEQPGIGLEFIDTAGSQRWSPFIDGFQSGGTYLENVLYGKVDKVLDERMQGFGQSLTPQHAYYRPDTGVVDR